MWYGCDVCSVVCPLVPYVDVVTVMHVLLSVLDVCMLFMYLSSIMYFIKRTNNYSVFMLNLCNTQHCWHLFELF